MLARNDALDSLLGIVRAYVAKIHIWDALEA
jgi:hypothetical protein